MTTAKKQELPDYWSVYSAINKQRISKSREFVDRKTGEKMSYEFIGQEHFSGSMFLKLFSGLLWMSPVLLIILMAILYLPACPFSLFGAIPFLILYHFAAMYYIIRGPYLKISQIKKKGLFARK